MTPELVLLKVLLNQQNYNQYRNDIDVHALRQFDRNLYQLYLVLDILIKKHPDIENFTLDELFLEYYSQYPGMKTQDKELVHGLRVSLDSIDTTSSVVSDVIRSIHLRALSVRIGLMAHEVSQGREDFGKLSKLLEECKLPDNTLDGIQTPFVSTSLQNLYQGTVKEQGLRWRLDSLNKRLGSLRKGDFGFVFARPETGKTTFLASECTWMAEQAKKNNLGPVLWFNNEEQGEKVMLRCFTAFTGKTLKDVINDMEQVQQDFSDRVGDFLKIVDSASIGWTDVERIYKKVCPSLIVFDQIDKIQGFKDDREDLRLGQIYRWAREVAKIQCPVIGICQADGSGEGVRLLTMGHVVNAKTAKQEEADWILGIGRDNTPGLDYVRWFNISKNKLVGDEDTRPELRHGNWQVLIEPMLARYMDITGET